MDHLIGIFLKESIELELNVGEVYQLFCVKFPEDYDFWWKISIEEMNHAALIESINDVFLTESTPSIESLEELNNDLHEMNLSIKARIEQYKALSPTRLEAFKYGFELENSIGESHFEIFMTSVPNSPVLKIFQKLNGDDVNHSKRIVKYMKDNTIA